MDKEAGNCSEPTRETQFSHIILPHILQDETLEIPQSFVKEHGSCLPNNVCLEITTGKMWKVELKRSDGRVWFGKGWKEFVEDCSIKDGYTLVFRYEDHFFFHVKVFNKRRVEIEYPVNPPTTKFRLEDSGDDDSLVEILDAWPQNNKETSVVNQYSEGISASTPRDGVIERARDFQSSNPSFTVTMRPAYLRQCYLYVPKAARSYFSGGANNSVCVNGPDGKSWSMRYRIYNSNIARLLGWGDFMLEYQLEDGDICVFELIDSTVKTFNLNIIRVTEQQADRKEADTCTPANTRNSTTLERAKVVECNNPSFTVVIKFNHQSLYYLFTLRVPGDHASRYLWDHHEKQVFLKGVADKT